MSSYFWEAFGPLIMPVLCAYPHKSTSSISKIRLGLKGSISTIKDQFWQNVIFRKLNLDEKGKNFDVSIHFVKDFKLFF